MSVVLDSKEIILDICEPRDFFGEEAHSTLNKIAQAVHETILNNCSIFEKSSLIQIFYNMFDESCYQIFAGEHFLTKDISMIKLVEKAPSIFRYLLEATIQSDESQEPKQINQVNKKIVSSFINGARIFLEVCNYSNYLYRNDFAGGITVSESGEINFRINEKEKKIEQSFVEKMRLLNKKMITFPKTIEIASNIKRTSMQEFAEPYDSLFISTYGISLSTIVGSAESIIFDVCKKRYGVVRISQNDLLKKIKRKTFYEKNIIKKALNFLEIDKDMFSKDYKFYKISGSPISVSRRPIIRLFQGSGDKGNLVYLGPNALARSLALIFADIDGGILKLGDVAEIWDKEKGPEFEKELKLILAKRGFKAIRVTDPPPYVGEIDAVAFNEKKRTLLVVEAKAPKIDLTLDKIKWHYERSRKWCKKVDKKVKWAKENAQMLIKRLNLPETIVKEVIGLIVTRVPWYAEEDLPYRVLSLEEFERLLDRISKP